MRTGESGEERDEAAAEVLSIGYFTTLQVLFATVLYSPGLLALAGVLSFVNVGTFLTTAGLAEFIIGGFFIYLLGLATPFAALLWAMTIKLIIGGDFYKNNLTAGTYPKWSRMHLRVWFAGRLERMVLSPLGLLYRSAPLMAFALRQLGANVGKNLQCAHDAALSGPLDLITIGDDVAIQTGAYIHTTRWSGQHLHLGPVPEGLMFAIVAIGLLRTGLNPIVGTMVAVLVVEIGLVLLAVAVKKALVGREWGADHSAPFWSWRHFADFFAQDCFFIWCRSSISFCAGTVLANLMLRRLGCRIGRRTIVLQPLQCFDWNAVSFGNDCVVDGVLQFHSFENMTLKVKRAQISDGCTVGFGATVMGGAVIERDTTLLPLSLVLKEMAMSPGIYQGSPAEPVDGMKPVPDLAP